MSILLGLALLLAAPAVFYLGGVYLLRLPPIAFEDFKFALFSVLIFIVCMACVVGGVFILVGGGF